MVSALGVCALCARACGLRCVCSCRGHGPYIIPDYQSACVHVVCSECRALLKLCSILVKLIHNQFSYSMHILVINYLSFAFI